MAAQLSISQTLRAAADLIEPEGRWTQGAVARETDGRPISAICRVAVCWCALGAIRKVDPAPSRAENFLRSQMPNGYVSRWNDDPTRTQSEVVAKLREAADLAEREGK